MNFLFNVLQLLITKHGGATLLVISAALALPVTNLAFKLHFIMGGWVRIPRLSAPRLAPPPWHGAE